MLETILIHESRDSHVSNLVISFSHSFASSRSSERTDGPQFHRYLPSRADGSFVVPIERPEGQLRMWFERRGSAPEDGWVVQGYKGDPIELERVKRQAVIEGGPFFGSVAFNNADAALIAELRLESLARRLDWSLRKRLFAQSSIRILFAPSRRFVTCLANTG